LLTKGERLNYLSKTMKLSPGRIQEFQKPDGISTKKTKNRGCQKTTKKQTPTTRAPSFVRFTSSKAEQLAERTENVSELKLGEHILKNNLIRREKKGENRKEPFELF